jgi:hypothetical protein
MWFTQKRASEIRLRLQVVLLVLPIVVEHATLIELVSIVALLRQRGDAAALEFEKFGLDRTGNGGDDFILEFE